MKISNGQIQYSNQPLIKVFIIALVMICCSFSKLSLANTDVSIDELLKNGKLKLSVELKKQNQIVPRQQAILVIKLSSYYDFSDNMKVDFFNVENAIVAKPFAKTDFKIENVNGKQWFIQIKEVALYPLKEGEFNVLPVLTQAFINVEGTAVTGNLETPPYQFNIASDNKLTGKEDYIASSKLEVIRDVVKQPEQPLNIGSAVTLTRELHADNLHAVMLPDLKAIQFDGAQTYEKPDNKSDGFDVLREISQAKIVSSVTLIFQQEGLFKLPEETILWWNTNKNQIETITVPEMSFQVGESTDEIVANAPQKVDSQLQNTKSTINWWLVIAICTALCFILAILNVIKQNKQVIAALFNQRSHYKKVTNRYLAAIEQSEYKVALACLYQISDIKHDNQTALKALVNTDTEQAILQLLFALAYSKENTAESISKQSAKILLQAIVDKRFESHFFTPVKFNMKLN